MVLGRLRLGWNWSYSKIKIIRNTSNKIMKELILICAYCPDDRRENILNDCINSLQKCRNEYDILISSHTEIPKYISQKVDYTFYDKNNDLITDLKYLNQSWFSPTNSMTILSTYVSKFSPYLAVYRLLIFGLGFAKMFKYKKIHYIEYDTIINDLSEINFLLLISISSINVLLSILYKELTPYFSNCDSKYSFNSCSPFAMAISYS